VAIHGNIEEAGLPDVLQLLTLGRKTGCLSVLDGDMHGEIYLDAGRISYAAVDNRVDRLGDILVKSGRITRDQLEGALADQKRNSKKQLGRTLLDSGAIERSELERVVRLQVEEAVYYLFTLKQGAFTFNTDRRPPHQFLSETLDAEGLLLEGARRVDEWSLIQKKVPSFDLVYRRTRDAHAISADDLTEEQRRILPLLDGTHDVAGVIDAMGMSEFDVGKALYGLIMAGFARLVERRGHIRHLDYRELLAWVVREAEFADPQRRKEAGRHIVDCPTCAERLRTVQVRRTEGSGVVVAASVPTDVPEESRAARTSRPRAAAVTQAVAPPQPAARKSAPKIGARATEPQVVARPAAAARVPAVASAPAPPTPPAPSAGRRSPVVPPLAARQSVAPPLAARQSVAPPVAARQSVAPPPRAIQPAPPAAPAPQFDRRNPDRRTGADRRHFERRAGLDRRCVANASWGLYYEERRRGPRREDDRRPGHAGGRRASDREWFGGMVASAAMPVRPAGPGERTTGPRRLVDVEARERDWSARVPEFAPGAEPSFVAPSALAGAPAPVRAPEVATPSSAPAAAEAVVAAPPPAAPGPAGAPDGEIEWLVSPAESTEMLRASRAHRRASEASSRATTAPAEPPTASVRVTAAPVAAPPPSAPPLTLLPSSGPSRFSPITNPTASARPQPPRTMGHLSWGDDVAQPPIAWSGDAPPAEPQATPVRTLVVLACLAFVGVLGYQAGRIGRHAPVGDAVQRVAAAPPAGESPAPLPSPRVRTSAGRVRENAATPAPAPARQAAASAPPPATGAQRGRGVAPPAVVAAPPANASVPAAGTAAAAAPVIPHAAAPAPPVQSVQRPGAPAQAAPLAAAPAAAPPAMPAPSVGVLRGVVRDASGAPVARARVSVRGTALAAVTDAAGSYEIRDVPDGAASVQAAADGYVAATADTRARAGATVAVDLALARAPAASEPDRELADGGWGRVDRAEALTILGGTMGAVDGLAIESISKSTAGTRQRVRVVQLTDGGQRIVLTETRAGAAVSGGAGAARVTALRVMPPSEAYPLTTGTASFGNILITVKTSIGSEALHALLERLAEVR